MQITIEITVLIRFDYLFETKRRVEMRKEKSRIKTFTKKNYLHLNKTLYTSILTSYIKTLNNHVNKFNGEFVYRIIIKYVIY